MKASEGYTGGAWDTNPADATITGAKTFTYTFTEKQAATVTQAPTAKTLTYTGSAQELVTAGTAEGGTMYYALGTAIEATEYKTSIPTATNAGTYTVWYKVVGDAGHNDTTPASVEVTIAPKAATVTADAKSKTYGDADPALTATVEGTVGSETLNYTLSRAAGNTVSGSPYAITVTLGSNPNYDVTATGADFTIAKKSATVTADAKSKTYGDADPALTATVEGTVGDETLNYTLSRAEGENVGSYGVTVTPGENPNYDVTATNGTFTIAKKSATVTADAKSKTYGDTDPALTATVTGTVGDDTLNYTLSRAEGENAAAYDITATLGENPNYDVSKTDGTFTIAKKSATVTADAKSKTYGDTDPALTATVTGTVGGDTLNYTLSRAEGENAAAYDITATLGENPNYDVTATGATFTIAKVPAPASLTEAQKPTAVTGLSETGGQHELVDAPVTPLEGYTPEYSIDGGTSWSTSIPTAKEKGTYTVKMRYTADSNHEPYTGTVELDVTIDKQADTIVIKDSPTKVKLSIDNRTGSAMRKILDDAKKESTESVTHDGGNTTTTTKEVSVELLVVDQTLGDIAAATGTSNDEDATYKTSSITEVFDVSLQKTTTTTTVTTKDSDGSLVDKDVVVGEPVPVTYSGGSMMVTLPYVKTDPNAVYSVIYAYKDAGVWKYEDMNANYDESIQAFTFHTTHTSTYFVYAETFDAGDVADAYELVLKPSGADGRTYDVILNAKNDKVINRFTSADLTFSLTGTVGKIVYNVAPNAGAYIKLNDALSSSGRYEFYVNGNDGAKDISDVTGKSITLGTVTFGGYGSGWKFQIDNAVVNTTKFNDNIVVTTEGAASDTVGAMVYTGASTTDAAPTAKIDPLTLNPDTKNLTVNVTFPNTVKDNASDYQDMTLTVSGGDLSQDIVVKLGGSALLDKDNASGAKNVTAGVTPGSYPYAATASIASAYTGGGSYDYGAVSLTADKYTVTLTQVLTVNTMYTVTVTGAGYRAARYNVLMDDNKTLTFWNNVMDADTVLETDKATSVAKVTYLAGDIVQDAQINVYDLSAVVSYFGDTNEVDAASPYAKYDLNRDGKIDSIDAAYVLVSWGK